MNPIRRELLNGLFVLVVASLLSAAFAAFQVSFNIQLWVLILIGVGIAVSGYVVFEVALGYMASTEAREMEWLKRVGDPARLELGLIGGSAGTAMMVDAVKAMRPGSDYTAMIWFDREGARMTGRSAVTDQAREDVFSAINEHLRRGTIREYKRILCFDHDVLEHDPELKSGILRVGEGPGTINRHFADHLSMMLETNGCSVYIAPVVLRGAVMFFGADKAAMTLETVEQDTGARGIFGVMLFSDPPNGEIIEQLRQIERATEKRMVAVHKIRFPEEAAAEGKLATG